MGTPRLSEFLRQQRDESEHAAESLRGIREEWVKAVGDLVAQIEGWLKTQETEGLLTVVRSEVTLQEERLGTYTAAALEIHVGERVINVLPIARLVFGGAGRVDLSYGPKVKILIRTDPTAKRVYTPEDGPRQQGPLKWMISGTDPRDRGTELGEESLSDAILFLLS